MKKVRITAIRKACCPFSVKQMSRMVTIDEYFSEDKEARVLNKSGGIYEKLRTDHRAAPAYLRRQSTH